MVLTQFSPSLDRNFGLEGYGGTEKVGTWSMFPDFQP